MGEWETSATLGDYPTETRSIRSASARTHHRVPIAHAPMPTHGLEALHPHACALDRVSKLVFVGHPPEVNGRHLVQHGLDLLHHRRRLIVEGLAKVQLTIWLQETRDMVERPRCIGEKHEARPGIIDTTPLIGTLAG